MTYITGITPPEERATDIMQHAQKIRWMSDVVSEICARTDRLAAHRNTAVGRSRSNRLPLRRRMTLTEAVDCCQQGDDDAPGAAGDKLLSVPSAAAAAALQHLLQHCYCMLHSRQFAPSLSPHLESPLMAWDKQIDAKQFGDRFNVHLEGEYVIKIYKKLCYGRGTARRTCQYRKACKRWTTLTYIQGHHSCCY